MRVREIEIRVNNEDIHISFAPAQALDNIDTQIWSYIIPSWIEAEKGDFSIGMRKFRIASKETHPAALLGNFPMSRVDYWIIEL